MADYFTHFSCLLDVGTPDKAARALALFQSLREADQDAEDPEVAGFDLVRQDAPEGSTLWIHDDDHGDVEAVIRFVLRLAEDLDLTGQIAPLVLMPGDPKRAARIAEQFLTDAVQVSDVRGIGAFTGTYQGVPMSVMASGMGIPSISIYATELFRFYGVKRICRVGTCGGISDKVKVRDVIIGSSASRLVARPNGRPWFYTPRSAASEAP